MRSWDRQSHNPDRCTAPHVNDDLKALLDGELPLWQRLRVSAHLTRCAPCRAELQHLRQLGRDLQHMDNARPRPELRQRILAALPETAAHPTPTPLPVRTSPDRIIAQRVALAGAGAVLAGLAALALLRPDARHIPQHSAHPQPPPLTADTSAPRPAPPIASRTGPDTPDTGRRATPRSTAPDDSEEFNRRFEALFAQRQRERERREQQQWQRTLAAHPELKRLTTPDQKPPVSLELRVTPGALPKARQALLIAVQQLGGTAYAPKPHGTHAEGTELQAPSLLPDVPENAIFLVRVPANRSAQFLKALREIGTVARVPNRAPLPLIAPVLPDPRTQDAERATPLHATPTPPSSEKTADRRSALFLITLPVTR
ncbi:MAG: zf-HC2 domain-containing protein [Chloroherpetonaceae bacterium]|nr:zf-HC2 domain-containing protein [Chthonomonadaceae bacterium]MDW8208288.1 zf-HC2 domain-containing protein [Chloroherpetonaceae bacterium]